MGVLSCNRRGCANIMCDRYSYKYGHLCNECFDELLDKGADADIEEFMGSKTPRLFNRSMAYEKWNGEFSDRGLR